MENKDKQKESKLIVFIGVLSVFNAIFAVINVFK